MFLKGPFSIFGTIKWSYQRLASKLSAPFEVKSKVYLPDTHELSFYLKKHSIFLLNDTVFSKNEISAGILSYKELTVFYPAHV